MSIVPTSNCWIPHYNNLNTQANLRLFCFPYAGGTTYTFRSWTNFLPSTVELCAIELPGRLRRLNEPPYQQLDLLLSVLAIALLPYFNKPFAFFGHSMGGLIGFELTRLLRKKFARSPVHLFVSGCRAFHLPNLNPTINSLDDEEFKQAIADYGGTPQEVINNEEMMELLMPTLRADFALFENYVYHQESPLDIPITVFGGKQDKLVTQEELAAWQKHTSTDFSLYLFEGGHFFLEEKRRYLLDYIFRKLDSFI